MVLNYLHQNSYSNMQKYGWEKPKKDNDLIVQHVLVLHVNLLESTLW